SSNLATWPSMSRTPTMCRAMSRRAGVGRQGGRVERVEWLYVPDAMTKAAALTSGEVDWWENPTPDIWPVLAANPEITLAELDAVDTPVPHSHALVVADLLRRLGLNVEIAASDWGNLTIRRASKKPINEGGWNVFGTSWFGADMLHPA